MADPARPTRILVADDDELIRAVLRMALSGPECHVFEASTVDEVTEVLSEGPADLAVLDISMPGGTIDTTIERIRQTCPLTRILVLSGDLEPPMDIVDVIDDFASKPIELEDLRDRVSRLLALHGSTTP